MPAGAKLARVLGRVRAAQERAVDNPAELLLVIAPVLLLEAAFDYERRVGHASVANAEVLRGRANVQFGTHRHGISERKAEEDHAAVLVTKARLASPLTLHRAGEGQVRPRPGQHRGAEEMRLTVEQDLVGEPLLAGRGGRARSGHSGHAETRVALQA